MGPSCEMGTEREQPVKCRRSPDRVQSERGSQSDCEAEEEKEQREACNTSWRRWRQYEWNVEAEVAAAGTERRKLRRK